MGSYTGSAGPSGGGGADLWEADLKKSHHGFLLNPFCMYSVCPINVFVCTELFIQINNV